jgi:hypothetical protein
MEAQHPRVRRRYVRRNVRGKQVRVETHLTFAYPKVFDIPYRTEEHHRFVLREVRWKTGRPSRFHSRKFAHTEAFRWQEAILRDAPLLKGFFKDEPAWREKMLHWCNKVISRGQSRSTGS